MNFRVNKFLLLKLVKVHCFRHYDTVFRVFNDVHAIDCLRDHYRLTVCTRVSPVQAVSGCQSVMCECGKMLLPGKDSSHIYTGLSDSPQVAVFSSVGSLERRVTALGARLETFV